MLWHISCIERKYTPSGIEVKTFVPPAWTARLAVIPNMVLEMR